MRKGADKRKYQHHSGKLCYCLFLHFCTVEKTVFFAKKEVCSHMSCVLKLVWQTLTSCLVFTVIQYRSTDSATLSDSMVSITYLQEKIAINCMHS